MEVGRRSGRRQRQEAVEEWHTDDTDGTDLGGLNFGRVDK